MKVVIVEWGGSGNDCLRGFLQFARAELERAGHRVHTLSIDDPLWVNKLVQWHEQERFELAIGMSGLGADAFLQDRRFLWEALKLPFFNWNCDFAAYYPTRHALRNPFLIHGYVFPDHARFAIDNLGGNGCAVAVHMGIPDRLAFPSAPCAAGQRNGRVLFAKSGGDLAGIEAKWRSMSRPLGEILFRSAEELLPGGSVRDELGVVTRHARSFGIFLHGANTLCLTLLRETDNYVRIRRAHVVLEAALDFPIDVYGGGWERLRTDGRRAQLKGAAPWGKVVSLFPQYVAALSTNPMVEESVHDRSFFGLAANVVPIADSNSFSRENLAELEEFTFRFDPLSVAAAIDRVLTQPIEALERTEACWNRVRDRFSMARSVAQIIDSAQLASLNQSVRWG